MTNTKDRDNPFIKNGSSNQDSTDESWNPEESNEAIEAQRKHDEYFLRLFRVATEMSKEELLEWLDDWFIEWKEDPKSFLYKKGLAEQAYQQIKQLIQNRMVVDEKDETLLDRWVSKFWKKYRISIGVREMLKQMLQEAHIEVKDAD